MKPKPWQPPAHLLAGWNALIALSKQPREDNPFRKRAPMRIWDWLTLDKNEHNRELGRKIRERMGR